MPYIVYVNDEVVGVCKKENLNNVLEQLRQKYKYGKVVQTEELNTLNKKQIDISRRISCLAEFDVKSLLPNLRQTFVEYRKNQLDKERMNLNSVEEKIKLILEGSSPVRCEYIEVLK